MQKFCLLAFGAFVFVERRISSRICGIAYSWKKLAGILGGK